MALTSYLRTDIIEKGKCSLCNECIRDNDDVSKVAAGGLESLQALAERWANVAESVCH